MVRNLKKSVFFIRSTFLKVKKVASIRKWSRVLKLHKNIVNRRVPKLF